MALCSLYLIITIPDDEWNKRSLSMYFVNDQAFFDQHALEDVNGYDKQSST